MKISIPNPCHENWNEMLPEEKGRFCLSCQKCVLDFTKLSDDEILKSLQKPNQCGRFSNQQLERLNWKLNDENRLHFARFFRYSTLMLTLGVSGTLVAQEKVKIEIVESNYKKSNQIKSDSIRIISGKIMDYDGFPIDSAKIVFLNGQITFTDENENFTIELINLYENPFQVTITDVFGQEYEKNMDISHKDFIELTCESIELGEVVYYRKRSFIGKVLHTLAWPFRQIGKLF